ncbi:MAG: GNAT family N-acetyltransferase [Desulforhopalus sp.]
MNTFHLSFMEHNDIEESVNVLSHAMLNNPLHVAVFQGNGKCERLIIEKTFLELFLDRPGIVLVVKDSNKIIGVMRMNSCTGKMVSAESAEVNDEQENIDRRQAFLLNEWAKRDPKKQHWHLGPIGVMPSHQGLGIGSLLMERFCQEVDACMAMAYLETDSNKNVRFYEKYGFNVVSESEIFGVKNRYMLRDSQP